MNSVLTAMLVFALALVAGGVGLWLRLPETHRSDATRDVVGQIWPETRQSSAGLSVGFANWLQLFVLHNSKNGVGDPLRPKLSNSTRCSNPTAPRRGPCARR